MNQISGFGQRLGSYVYGDLSSLTPQQLARRRAAADQLMTSATTGPAAYGTTPGEGLGSALRQLGTAALWRGLNNRVEQQEERQRQGAVSQFENVFQGGAGARGLPATSTYTPQGGIAAGGSSLESFNQDLSRRESGGNYQAMNAQGYAGKYQFGQRRLDDFNRANGTQYQLSDLVAGTPHARGLTEAVQKWHVGDIDNFIMSNGLNRYVGQEINGVPVTIDGMRRVAHLGGRDGLKKHLESGGRYNPADANSTTLTNYMAGGQGDQRRHDPMQLLALIRDPSLPETDRSYAATQLEKLMNPAAREHAVDRYGVTRYLDTGEPVFPDAKPEPLTEEEQLRNEATKLANRKAAIELEIEKLDLAWTRDPAAKPLSLQEQAELEQARARLQSEHLEIEKRQLEMGWMKDPDSKPLSESERVNLDTAKLENIAAAHDNTRSSIELGHLRLFGTSEPDDYQKHVLEELRKGADPTKIMSRYEFENPPGTPTGYAAYVARTGPGAFPEDQWHMLRNGLGQIVVDPETGEKKVVSFRELERQDEAEEQAKRAEKRRQDGIASARRMLENTNSALGSIERGWGVTGLLAPITNKFGGTESHDLAATLTTMEAVLSFETLDAMRQSSPTGGALGQVSNFEIELLKAAISSLKQSQSKEQLVRNLHRVRNIQLDIIYGTENDAELRALREQAASWDPEYEQKLKDVRAKRAEFENEGRAVVPSGALGGIEQPGAAGAAAGLPEQPPAEWFEEYEKQGFSRQEAIDAFERIRGQ